MHEKSELVRKSEGELARNRELTQTLYDLEQKIRIADESLTAARREQDELRFSNTSVTARNDDMKSEIEALQHHCNVLTA